jgi:adenine-specific DNA-methyltransferase
LVQAPEKPDGSEESGKNALQAGYKTIFDITAERLRRAAQLDGLAKSALGFRVFRATESNLIVDPPIIAPEGMTGEAYVQASLVNAQSAPVVDGADPLAVAWELALKATATQLDAVVAEHDLDGVKVYEFTPAGATADDSTGRLLISLDAFDLTTAEALGLTDDDTLILRGDKVADAVTLTLAPRLQSKLVMLERVPREVSL